MKGYVVEMENGVATLHSFYPGEPKVLVYGDDVHLFASHQGAYAAIRRSRNYATKRGLPWATNSYKVKRVTA